MILVECVGWIFGNQSKPTKPETYHVSELVHADCVSVESSVSLQVVGLDESNIVLPNLTSEKNKLFIWNLAHNIGSQE